MHGSSECVGCPIVVMCNKHLVVHSYKAKRTRAFKNDLLTVLVMQYLPIQVLKSNSWLRAPAERFLREAMLFFSSDRLTETVRLHPLS